MKVGFNFMVLSPVHCVVVRCAGGAGGLVKSVSGLYSTRQSTRVCMQIALNEMAKNL